MNHLDMLSSGALAIEFQPKYHDRYDLKQILRTAFPHDFNFEEFDDIQPTNGYEGSVWFSAYNIDDPDKFGNYKEWTFQYEEPTEMCDVLVIPMDEFKFGVKQTIEEINQFLDKYGTT